jgi:glycerol-3-phosphate acyltransferase PlsX
VCDGFVGNVALKTSEGLAQMIATFLREEFSRGPLRKLMYLAAMTGHPGLPQQRFDPSSLQWRQLLGLKGIVVKSHGSSDAYGFEEAVAKCGRCARNDLIARITHCMTRTEVAA